MKNPFKKSLPTSAPAPELSDVSNFELLISKLLGWMGLRQLKGDMADLARRPYQRQPGEGVKRARERLAAKRKANEAIPSGDFESRQRRRRAAILRGRQIMRIARQEAMQRDIRGGSAIIRNPVDVDRVLG